MARTLQISDRQREALLKLKDMSAEHILCGMFESLAHAPIHGQQMGAFIKAMQQEMPKVFRVFGDDPEKHLQSFVPMVLAECEDGYHVQEQDLANLRQQLKAETGWDLSHANSATWILSALFVQFRGSLRPPPPARTTSASPAD